MRWYLPKLEFPSKSNVTFSDNHWSNTNKSMELFKWIIFPHFNKVKGRLKHPKEQMPFIVMDTFKEKNKTVTIELRKKQISQFANVQHNIWQIWKETNQISNKYKAWFSEQVSKQLATGTSTSDTDLPNLTHFAFRWRISLLFLAHIFQLLIQSYFIELMFTCQWLIMYWLFHSSRIMNWWEIISRFKFIIDTHEKPIPAIYDPPKSKISPQGKTINSYNSNANE